MNAITVGSIVQYKQEFLSPYTGVGHQTGDFVDMCGEVIGVKTFNSGKKVIRIRWDDDHESSALASSLSVAKVPPTAKNDNYQDDLLERRTITSLSSAINVRESWNKSVKGAGLLKR